MSEDKTGTQQKPQAAGSGEGILDNEQVFQLLMSKIDERVLTRIQETFDRRYTRLILIFTAVIILVTAIGSAVLDLFVQQAVEQAVERELGPAVTIAEGAVHEAQFEAQVAALNFRVLSIDIAEGFKAEDANSVITQIKELYSQELDSNMRDKLRFAIETATKNFALVLRPEYVYQLEDVAPDLFETSGAITEMMIQLLGNRLLLDAGAPRSWLEEEGPMRKTYVNYRRYADRANNIGLAGLSLVYELLLRSAEGRPREEIENLIEDSDALKEGDSLSFIGLMSKLLAGNLGVPGEERVTNWTKAFLCAYREDGAFVSRVSKEAGLQCS